MCERLKRKRLNPPSSPTPTVHPSFASEKKRSSGDRTDRKDKKKHRDRKKSSSSRSSSKSKRKKDKKKHRDKKKSKDSGAPGSDFGKVKKMGAVDQDAYGKNGVLREADYFNKQREFEVKMPSRSGSGEGGSQGRQARTRRPPRRIGAGS